MEIDHAVVPFESKNWKRQSSLSPASCGSYRRPYNLNVKETSRKSLTSQFQCGPFDLTSIKFASLEGKDLIESLETPPPAHVSKEELLYQTRKRRTTLKQQEPPSTDAERKLKCEYEKIKLVRGIHYEVSGGLMKARLRTTVEEWATAAVNSYNKQVKYEKMRLKHIKEALYLSLPVLVYHINFDVILVEEDGKEAPWACQAVVYKERKNGSVEVFSLKLGSAGGEGTDGWCREKHDCVCGVYSSLDNELGAKKMKHNESFESGGGTQK